MLLVHCVQNSLVLETRLGTLDHFTQYLGGSPGLKKLFMLLVPYMNLMLRHFSAISTEPFNRLSVGEFHKDHGVLEKRSIKNQGWWWRVVLCP